jgi:hypothetical protein
MRVPTSLLLAAGSAALAALLAAPAAADLYKSVDANGRVVYSDQPPPGVKAERLNVTVPPADPKAVRDMANKDAEIKKRQQQRAEDEAKAGKAEADARKKLEQCTELRGRIKTLQGTTAVYRYNEKGEAVFMETSDRQKAIADSEKMLRDLNCPPPAG